MGPKNAVCIHAGSLHPRDGGQNSKTPRRCCCCCPHISRIRRGGATASDVDRKADDDAGGDDDDGKEEEVDKAAGKIRTSAAMAEAMRRGTGRHVDGVMIRGGGDVSRDRWGWWMGLL